MDRNNAYQPLLPGALAPDFSLPYVKDGTIAQMTFSDYIKDSFCLLFFYPLDFGYVTPTELYQLKPLLPQFQELNCKVITLYSISNNILLH